MKRSPHWLALLPASPSFRAAADATLRPVALERAGVDLADGFALMPHDEFFDVRYTEKGVGWLQGDLVGPDAVAEPAAIAWVRRSDPADHVALLDDIRPQEIQIFWHRFPAEALRARYGGAFEPPFAVPVPAGATVRFRPFSWPELWLEVELDEPWTANQEAAVAASARAFVDHWNQGSDRGTIHGLSALAAAGPRGRVLRIDFGSARTEALGELLTALAATPGLPLHAFGVAGSPAAATP